VSILWFCAASLSGQDNSLLKAAATAYPIFAKESNIHQYTGLVDGVHTLNLILFEKKGEWRGMYRMTGSGLTFKLESETSNASPVLLEFDEEGRNSGTIKGDWTGDSFSGYWFDVSGSTSFEFTF